MIAILAIAMITSMTACSKKSPAVAPNSSTIPSSQESSISDMLSSSSDISSSSTINSSSTASGSTSKAQSSSSNKSVSSTTTAKTTTASTKTAKSGTTTTGGKTSTTTTAPSAKTGNGTTTHGSTTQTTGGKTYTPPKQTTTQSSQTTKPSAQKTAYDRPFDANQIRNDMIAYGQSKGMRLDTSLWVKSDFSTNAGYDPPTDTSQDVYEGDRFKKSCQEDIDATIAGIKVTEPTAKNSDIGFNIVLNPKPSSPGNYYIFVLYG